MTDKTFINQYQRTFKAFQKTPATMLQVAKGTGILRANICRYVAQMRKAEKIAIVKKGKCPISKHKAGFLTTNEKLFPKKSQTDLFDGQTL